MNQRHSSQDTLTIDPVAMNVVNRVAEGSRLAGAVEFNGGVLVQGELGGEVTVRGCLIVWAGGLITGRVRVLGSLYVFGRLGLEDANPADTVVECLGTAYMANTAVSTGTLLAHRLRLYDGAQLHGPFKTLRRSAALPVLSDRVDGGEPGEDAANPSTSSTATPASPASPATIGHPATT